MPTHSFKFGVMANKVWLSQTLPDTTGIHWSCMLCAQAVHGLMVLPTPPLKQDTWSPCWTIDTAQLGQSFLKWPYLLHSKHQILANFFAFITKLALCPLLWKHHCYDQLQSDGSGDSKVNSMLLQATPGICICLLEMSCGGYPPTLQNASCPLLTI